MKSKFCKNSLEKILIDMVNISPYNSKPIKEQSIEEGRYFSQIYFFCEKCWIAQSDEYKSSSLIEYNVHNNFRLYSELVMEHAEDYVNMITKRLVLSLTSKVMDIESKDFYLLQLFFKKVIPCFGVESPDGNSLTNLSIGCSK